MGVYLVMISESPEERKLVLLFFFFLPVIPNYWRNSHFSGITS